MPQNGLVQFGKGSLLKSLTRQWGKDANDLLRAASAGAKVVAKEGQLATLRLPSCEIRLVPQDCLASKKIGYDLVSCFSRAFAIVLIMIGHTIVVHNGREHLPIYVINRMVGHKLGAFVPTQNFREHAKNDKGSRR
ncbi:hypothetical protein L7F22_010678 [Adiantum nelumboides]|nr:hypothetical protein [Adiantum nelumboides]